MFVVNSGKQQKRLSVGGNAESTSAGVAAGAKTPPPTYICFHQLALRTPGISPWSASLRKQIRQIPNLRYTARGRPQSRQRFSWRVLNFGVAFALAIFDLLATEVLFLVYRPSAFGSRLSARQQFVFHSG
jgi:hypothetical protein